MKPITLAVADGHSPKIRTPIRELPTSWKPADRGIVPLTPIRLNEMNYPICPIVQRAPAQKATAQVARSKAGRVNR